MDAFRKTALTAAILATLLGCDSRQENPKPLYVYETPETYAPAPVQSAPPAYDQPVYTPAAVSRPQVEPIPAVTDYAAPEAVYLEATSAIAPLESGPIHEAFAAPAAGGQAMVIALQPPQPIQEIAPEDEKPLGDNVLWIPGYWNWDNDRQGFIWVSGTWRVVPPDMRWVSGYWMAVDGGWTWVSGFWTTVTAPQVVYLPAPPPVIIETVQPAPVDDVCWAPGYWYYSQHRYVWRPGRWIIRQEGWTWIPARYVYTPRGYIFVHGYWDYRFERRGLLFAPVCFDQPVYHQPHYVHRPTIVINVNIVVVNLFVRERDCHYVYGNFYDARYSREGIFPLVETHRRGLQDPIFADQKWHHRNDDPRWEDHQRERYEQIRDRKLPPPEHTLVARVEPARPTAAPAPAVPIRRIDRDERTAPTAVRPPQPTRPTIVQPITTQPTTVVQGPKEEPKPEPARTLPGPWPRREATPAPVTNAPRTDRLIKTEPAKPTKPADNTNPPPLAAAQPKPDRTAPAGDTRPEERPNVTAPVPPKTNQPAPAKPARPEPKPQPQAPETNPPAPDHVRNDDRPKVNPDQARPKVEERPAPAPAPQAQPKAITEPQAPAAPRRPNTQLPDAGDKPTLPPEGPKPEPKKDSGKPEVRENDEPRKAVPARPADPAPAPPAAVEGPKPSEPPAARPEPGPAPKANETPAPPTDRPGEKRNERAKPTPPRAETPTTGAAETDKD